MLCLGRQLAVPNALKGKVISMVHGRAHAGKQGTLEAIKRYYFWRGMSVDIAQFCKACHICSKSKCSHTPKQTLQPYELGELHPRSAVAMDVATLPWSDEHYRYFLLVVDMFTRHIELVTLHDQTSESIENAFTSGWIHRHGVPKILVSDQGRNVDGGNSQTMCKVRDRQKTLFAISSRRRWLSRAFYWYSQAGYAVLAVRT